MHELSRRARLALTGVWSAVLVLGLAAGTQAPGGLSGESLALASVVTTTTTATGGSGCTPGFYKNHLSDSVLDDPLSTLGFTLSSISGRTISDALDKKVGSTNREQQLIRTAVAAIYTATYFGSAYSSTYSSPAAVIAAVQGALSSGAGIEQLKDILDALNNQGCPISRIPS